MREQLDLMVRAGHLALSNEGKYRLTAMGKEQHEKDAQRSSAPVEAITK